MSAVTLELNRASAASEAARGRLNAACNEFLGMVTFGTMLRQARESTLNSELLHSRAERVFQSQLDDVLLRKATRGEAGEGMFGRLGQALQRQLGRGSGGNAPATVLDSEE